MLAAIDQVEVMTAVMGDEKSLYRAPVGFFLPGTPSASDAGMDAVRRRPSTDEIKAMLKQAGYGGERVVLMHPTDQTFYDAMSSVVAASLRRVGINLDEQSLDWGTVVQRRTSKEPLDKGGWSLFPYGAPAAEYRDPIFATNLRGNGKDAWFGWPSDEKMEAMRTAWMDSNDEAERKRLDAEIQARAFETVPFIPLGQYLPPSAWRSNLTGILKGAVPVFWNVSKDLTRSRPSRSRLSGRAALMTLPRLLIRRLPFFYGWVILGCACCAGFSRQGGAVATLSIFVEPMTREFGWSRTASVRCGVARRRAGGSVVTRRSGACWTAGARGSCCASRCC